VGGGVGGRGAIKLARICHSRILGGFGGELHISASTYFFHGRYASDPWLKLQVEAQAQAGLVHHRASNGDGIENTVSLEIYHPLRRLYA
jgi:hypothetical protein